MNWKYLTVVSSIALSLIAVPTADAQRSRGGRASAGPGNSRMQPSIQAGPRTQFAARGGLSRVEQGHRWDGRRGGENWRNRDGNRWHRGDRDRWGRGDRWRHRRHYPRYYYPRYYSGFYPYGFGYPYGYGFGYGYPYFGSTLYYSSYSPGYGSSGVARGGSVVAEVQQELSRAGYYRGAIDGVIGSGTRSAIRAYERANGLRVDGRIDQELLSSMGLG